MFIPPAESTVDYSVFYDWLEEYLELHVYESFILVAGNFYGSSTKPIALLGLSNIMGFSTRLNA